MSHFQNLYLTKMIRAGYEKSDVDLFAALCQQCKTDIGKSREYMFLLLDMAQHNKCDVLDIVKTGRVCSNQKAINDKFIDAVIHAVDSDGEGQPSTGVLDLTAEESLSGSYEETSQEYNDRPTSNEAYEIDGFVVEDDDDGDRADKAPLTKSRKLKRRLEITSQE